MKATSILIRAAGLLVCLCAIGCGGMARSNVIITPDQSLKGTSIEVHIIALSDVNSAGISTESMTTYWEDPPRRDDVYVMKFGQGLPAEITLPRSHELWSKWRQRGANNLFLLSSYPGGAKDQVGNADPRRLRLPLNKKAWNNQGLCGDKTIRITIRPRPGGLECLTPTRTVY